MAKQFKNMTLKELKQYEAVAVKEIRNRGGDVFPIGTRFEIHDKFGGLSLREIGGEARTINRVNYAYLKFELKAATTPA